MTTILVVDDSPMDRRLAGGLLLKNPDWSVAYAHDGKEALDQLQHHTPDLVITDLQMPHMDGLELVESAQKQFPLVPVVLMTSQGSEEIAVKALQKGAASYVQKRRLSSDLEQTVKMVLDATRLDRTRARLMTDRMTKNESAYALDNDLSLIPALIKNLQRSIQLMGLFDEGVRLRLGVALEESLLNAFYHGNLEVDSKLREKDHKKYYQLAKQRCQESPYCERRVHVEAKLSRDEAVYIVRDEGPGFDPSKLPDPTDPAYLDRPSGRGLLLMHTFMDSVSYNDVGNQVTLIKRRATDGSENVAGEEA